MDVSIVACSSCSGSAVTEAGSGALIDKSPSTEAFIHSRCSCSTALGALKITVFELYSIHYRDKTTCLPCHRLVRRSRGKINETMCFFPYLVGCLHQVLYFNLEYVTAAQPPYENPEKR